MAPSPQDGDIQLFSATARRLLTSTWLQGDAIRSVTLLGAGPQAGAGALDAPYILLGCESGNVRVVALLDGQGQPAAGARPVADLALQPFGLGSVDEGTRLNGQRPVETPADQTGVANHPAVDVQSRYLGTGCVFEQERSQQTGNAITLDDYNRALSAYKADEAAVQAARERLQQARPPR